MKKIHLTNNYALINFDAINFHSKSLIINSKSFELLFKNFHNILTSNDSIIIENLKGTNVNDLLNLSKLLLIYDLDDAIKQVKSFESIHIKPFYQFIESLYDYWRNLERFGLLKGSKNYDQNNRVHELITTTNDFNNLVITLYRTIAEKLMGRNFNIYRQLPAGINANMLYVKHRFQTKNLAYNIIQDIPFVTKIVTNPPFIIKSKSNTRVDYFKEIDFNPLSELSIKKSEYIAFPILVGPLLAFVYIHRDFIHHGIALSNLFEFANYDSFEQLKPDMVFVYGINENEYDCTYYFDEDEDFYVGFVSRLDKNDYFGYLKKMLLTLHNVSMIKKGNLPIHGAMVNILLNDNTSKNVVIIGDSGAGKSETLEALRIIGSKDIKSMDIVFDDMGTFKINNKNEVVASGTEIGAFVRLDDLDTGYAYEIMDRALFLNPNKVNARVVIPISSYDFINTEHKVDLLLYANNYAEGNKGLSTFEDLNLALNTFREGVRKAKGTTSEIGLVKSYFANPFGPVQMEIETDKLLVNYFNLLSKNNVVIGEIYTKLAVESFESKGPLEAATYLLKYLKGVK